MLWHKFNSKSLRATFSRGKFFIAIGFCCLALFADRSASAAGFPWSRKPKTPTFADDELTRVQQAQPNVTPTPSGIGMPEQPSTTSKIASALNPAKAARSVGNSVKQGTAKISSAMKPKPKEQSTAKKKSGWFSKEEELSPEFHVSIARVHEQAGSNELAAEQYQRALERDAKNRDALLGYARLLDRQGQFVKATDYYQRALKAHPGDATAANDLGLCYARQGKFNEAFTSLGKAVELEPTRDLYRNNIATVLVEMNRIPEAIAQVAAVYGEPVAHYNVGMMLHKRGQREAAAEQFSIALQKNPGLDQARQWLAQIHGEQQREQFAMRQPPYGAPPVSANPALDHGAMQSRPVGVAVGNSAAIPPSGAAFMQSPPPQPPQANAARR